MILKKQTHSQLMIQVPELMNSVTSEGSISNFVAQTPKQTRLNLNFKKAPQLKANEQKQNTSESSNTVHHQFAKRGQLPYKMITSELPASCSNHSDRQSSFYIESEEGEFIFYCEKCAILVASQGFQVKKIQSTCKQKNLANNCPQNNSVRFSIKDTKTVKKSKMGDFLTKQQKQTQLTNFLNNLQRLQSRIDKTYQTNQSYLGEIDSAVEGEGHKIKDIFLGLHKILDEYEHAYLDQLEHKCVGMREPLQILNQEISSDTNTLESMKEDICQAYDDIINQTTNSEFQTVMNAYKENTSQIESALNGHEQPNNYLGSLRREVEIQIKAEQIVGQIQRELTSRVDSTRRQSIKSTKRRMSIAVNGNKIR